MAERRQLPPQIRRVERARRTGSKPVVRYQLTVDTGIVDGKRKQLRRRYRTENEARTALAEIQGQGRFRDIRAAVNADRGTSVRGLVCAPATRSGRPPQPATRTSCSLCAVSSARLPYRALPADTSTISS
jgi:hypothetical protein